MGKPVRLASAGDPWRVLCGCTRTQRALEVSRITHIFMNTEKTEGATLTKSWIRRHPVWSGVIVFLVVGLIGSNLSGSKGEPVSATPAPVKEEASSAPSVSKAEAQKELEHIMDLSKQVNFATSYEFSDSASVVYAGSGWYAQDVAFKKNFLAKVGALKKAITGYQHFEVRDAKSNEKVGEITAFSGSLEVYK
jgi:hypothetical protein